MHARGGALAWLRRPITPPSRTLYTQCPAAAPDHLPVRSDYYIIIIVLYYVCERDSGGDLTVGELCMMHCEPSGRRHSLAATTDTTRITAVHFAGIASGLMHSAVTDIVLSS